MWLVSVKRLERQLKQTEEARKLKTRERTSVSASVNGASETPVPTQAAELNKRFGNKMDVTRNLGYG